MKKQHPIIIIVLIFVISVAVRYYPVFHKGYSSGLNTTNLILARNLSLTGEYKMVDGKDIVLSSSLIKERGVDSNTGNKLTSILYSKIFDIFDFNRDVPLYASILLYSITTILLFLLVLRLFNLEIALIFAGIDIFMPFVLNGVIRSGFYEFAMLFFIIALLIYLWGKRAGYWRLFLASIFFGLASLARNAFLISFIPFVIYDWYTNFVYKKDWRLIKTWFWPAIKRIFIFALPVILLWGGFMVQGYLGGRVNQYLSRGDTGYDGHLFRDPYTYRFNKDNYIEEIRNGANGETIGYLKAYNYNVSWKQSLIMYFYSIKYYLNSFFRQPTIGGPLIIFFLILGVIYLFKFRRSLLTLTIFWIGILFFVLIYLSTSNEAHFLEIRFPLILLISLGIYWAWKWLDGVVKDRRTYYLLVVALFLVLFLHLVQTDKWLFHESYLYSDSEEKVNLVDTIKKSTVNIGTDDVIAVSKDTFFLNYYTDYNYIYFNPETIKELLKENKLQWAFDQFDVTKIIGYNNTLTLEIIQNTKAKTIVGLSPED